MSLQDTILLIQTKSENTTQIPFCPFFTCSCLFLFDWLSRTIALISVKLCSGRAVTSTLRRPQELSASTQAFVTFFLQGALPVIGVFYTECKNSNLFSECIIRFLRHFILVLFFSDLFQKALQGRFNSLSSRSCHAGQFERSSQGRLSKK